MKQVKTALAIISVLFIHSAKAQWKDSASYKQYIVQFYKQHTSENQTYHYKPDAYSRFEQDTMFANALAWKKVNVDYPLLFNYLKIEKGTFEAEAKIKYFEDPANAGEYKELLAKAAAYYTEQAKGKKGKHVAPGLSTSTTPGKIENHDKEIKEKVLKNWKF